MHRIPLLLCLLLVLLPVRADATLRSAAGTTTLATIENETEHIRALKHTRGVNAKFLSNSAFNTVVRNQLQRDNPNNEIELSRRESVLLGLLGKSQSLRQVIYGGMVSQVIGMYDYHVKTLYIRGQTQKAFGVDRYVISHEFTHALQDQHWGLGKLMPDQTALTYRNSDALEAHHALAEGDATNTQYLFISREYTPLQIQQLYAEASQNPGQQLPPAFQREFNFPYTSGLTFVKTLYNRGGMSAVDAAYSRPPSSTYEILHPAAYLKHWKPLKVSLHGIAGFADWKQTDDDVFGALGYKVFIWQFGKQSVANGVINGYRGDRYIFLENGDQEAIVMKSVWLSAKAATTAKAAIASSLRTRFKRSKWSHGGTVLRYSGGATYLARTGKKLTLVLAPTADLAHGMGTARTS